MLKNILKKTNHSPAIIGGNSLETLSFIIKCASLSLKRRSFDQKKIKY